MKRQKLETTEIQQQIASLKYYTTPKSDNQKLMNLQWEYRHGDAEAIDQMYESLVEIGKKFIGAIGKRNKHVRRLSTEDRDIKSRDAATYMIEQMITRPDFFITKNIPGYLFLRIEHELFYRTKADEIVDFVDLVLFFKEGEEDHKLEELEK